MPKTLMVPVRTVKTKLVCDCGKEMKFKQKRQNPFTKLYSFLYGCEVCNIVYESKRKYPIIDHIEDPKATLTEQGSPMTDLLKKSRM